MDVLFKLLNFILAAPDSLVGMAASASILLALLVWSTCRNKRLPIRATYGDWAAMLYVAVQCATLMVSKLRPNTIHFVIPFTVALNVYVAVRLLATYPLWSTSTIVRGMLVVAFIVAIGNLIVQIPSIRVARQLFPPEALSSIRASLPIVGGPTRNDGLAIVLCLLPYAYVAATSHRHPETIPRVMGALTASALTGVLILGYSRSIYCALALLLIAYAILGVRRHQQLGIRIVVILLLSGIVAASVACWTGSWEAIAETASYHQTASQERSTAGRLIIWRESLSSIALHPIVGNGGGVDGVLALRQLRAHDRPFTAHAYNAVVSVLLSSGIVGLICYAIMLCHPLLSLIRRSTNGYSVRVSSTRYIIACGLGAIMLRDMSYSSLVSCGSTIIATWISAALLANGSARSYTDDKRHFCRVHYLGWIALAMTVIMFVPVIQTVRGEYAYSAACKSLSRGNYMQAHQQFQEAIAWDSRQPMYYAADGLSLERQAIDPSSDEDMSGRSRRINQTQKDLLRNAQGDILQALRQSNDDASLWCDLGWLEMFQGDKANAAMAFAQAIQRDPNDPIALISKAMADPITGNDARAIDEYAAAVAAYPRILDSSWFSELRTQQPDVANDVAELSYALLLAEVDSPIRSASLGKFDLYRNNRVLARSELSRAVTNLPNLTYAWANLGVLNLIDNNTAEAKNDLMRARYLDGSNRLAANLLAKLEYDSGDIKTAENLYTQTLLMPEQSIHSIRIWRLYHVIPPLADDLIPSELIDHISPVIMSLDMCDPDWLNNLGNRESLSSDAEERVIEQNKRCASR